MKKYIFLLFVFIFLSACTPQEVISSEVTVTLPPTSSPILEATSTSESTTTPVAETVTIAGVTLTLDDNGVMTDMQATGATAEIKAQNLAAVDPAQWGLPEGKIVKDKSGMHIVVEEQNVAWWTGAGWEWDWAVMENLEGRNPFFVVAKQWENLEEDSARIKEFADADKAVSGRDIYVRSIYIVSEDGKNKVGAVLKSTDPEGMTAEKAASGEVSGYVYLLNEKGKPVKMKVQGLKFQLR